MATATQRATLVEVFDTPERAHAGVEALQRAGFSRRQVTMVSHHPGVDPVEVTDLDAAKAAAVSGESKERKGLIIGAIVGAVVGVAIAIGLLSLSQIGPTMWSPHMFASEAVWGIIAALALGLFVGAAAGAFIGAIVGLDFPDREAILYERELKAGHALVGVKAGQRELEAREILCACGGHDLP